MATAFDIKGAGGVTLTRGGRRLTYSRVPVLSGLLPRPPSYKGPGFIAGTSPDGLVTFNGAPAVRTVDLFDRATAYHVASTVSASDGTYAFYGLSLDRAFDVVARGSSDTENDLIAARVVPAIPPLALVGTFDPIAASDGAYRSTIAITGGLPPYSNPQVATGSLPTGLTLSLHGSVLVLEGTVTGSTATFTVSADSTDSQTATSGSITITVYTVFPYWRLLVTAVQAADFNASLAELEFHATVGGAQQATGGTAMASSVYPSGTTYQASQAFDGNPATRWAAHGDSGAGLPQWIGYAFATDVGVGELLLIAGNADDPGNPPRSAPVAFTLQRSLDNLTWFDRKSWTTPATWTTNETRTFTV